VAFIAGHLDRVSAAVAFETAPRLVPSPDDDFGVEPETLARMANASVVIDIDTHIGIVAPARKDEPGFKSWFRRYNRSASSGIRIDDFIKENTHWDIRDLLPAIEVPVLVMHRTGNTILPIRNARALVAALPNARLAEIEGPTAIFADDVEDADEIEAFTGRGRRRGAFRCRNGVVHRRGGVHAAGGRARRPALASCSSATPAAARRARPVGGHGAHRGHGFPRRSIRPRHDPLRPRGGLPRSIGRDPRGVHRRGRALHVQARCTSGPHPALAGAGQFVSSTVKEPSWVGPEFLIAGHELKGVPGCGTYEVA
jgi:hypothetical protein